MTLEKRIEKQLKQTDYLLNSINALGYTPMINTRGGLIKRNQHIVFSDGKTQLYYCKQTNTYEGMKRK